MHGDYHAANVMFSPTGPEVVAIVDWEMCTIGDPLVDLGWMLATWFAPGRDSVLTNVLMNAGGLATPDELIERYAQNTTRDLSNIDWYTVLACSSWASSSRAPTPARLPAWRPRRLAIYCTSPQSACSSGRWRRLEGER